MQIFVLEFVQAELCDTAREKLDFCLLIFSWGERGLKTSEDQEGAACSLLQCSFADHWS